jgi:hypothetical protein
LSPRAKQLQFATPSQFVELISQESSGIIGTNCWGKCTLLRGEAPQRGRAAAELASKRRNRRNRKLARKKKSDPHHAKSRLRKMRRTRIREK